jgi:hypothetical protein
MAFMRTGIRVIVLVVAVLTMALVPRLPFQGVRAADCQPWPGGGLDDELYQSLYSINAPLQGHGDIDKAAARALWEAWHDAGHPDGFDATPYLKPGPGCEDGGTVTTEPPVPPPAEENDNDDGAADEVDNNDNDWNDNDWNDNDWNENAQNDNEANDND